MKIIILFFLLVLLQGNTIACTIVSGIDRKGQTWVMNNEDFFHTYSNYVNVYPAQNKTLGYITLTYGSPDSGIQGGVNEAGVFFDINALPPQDYKLSADKKPFTSGSMLLYLLQHCKTVPQFLKLWETQYMPGMNDFQIHLADKNGNLAIITPDTIVSSKTHLTSTNFNVCESGAAKQACWRYPIAQQILNEEAIGKESFVKMANATSWREFTTTLYTNIHNLSSGEIWFYLAEDYDSSWHTDVNTLLKGGRKSILLATKFPNNASLNLNKIIQQGGKSDNINLFLQKGEFSDVKNESILRLSFLNYFFIEKDFDKAGVIFPEWEKYIYENKKLDATEVKITKAQVLAAQGKDKEAIAILNGIQTPNGKRDELLRNLSEKEGSNITLELKGFQEARSVLVEVKGDYNFFRVLRKTQAGWVLKMKSDRKELKYCFYVDGKRIVNPSAPTVQNQETVKGDFASFNFLKL